MDRRTLLGLAAAAPLLGSLEQVRRTFDHALPLVPSELDTDEWERVAADYAVRVLVEPPERLFAGLAADLNDLRARMAESSGTVRTDLTHAFAQLAALCAIALVQVHETDAANRWWRTASRAAAATGDRELAGLIAGRQAVFSLYSSSPATVLALADRAVAVSPPDGVGRISGLAARAQVHARTGNDGAALTALREVTEMFPDLPASTAPYGVWSWPEQRLRFVASEVHSHAGRTREAFAEQEAALRLYPSSSWGGPAQLHAHRATALIKAGDLTAGTEHLAGTLAELKPWQRRDALVHRSAAAALACVPPKQRGLPSVRRVRALLAEERQA